MKYLKLLLLLIPFALLNAQENKEALPEIPQLSIDAKPQETKKQETQSTQKPLITPELKENGEDNNATKRERDPFTPIITPKDSGQITNAPQLNLFTKTELILPSTARKIKKITLEYQNLNGSITTLEQDLDGDIDWHFPLILSQEVQPQSKEIPNKQNFALQEPFSFELTQKNITLFSNLPLLRDFTLASPTRLILDFKAPNKQPLKEQFLPKIPTFPEISLDTHLDFYRITIMLDGQYKYDLSSDEKTKSYFIEFH